MKRIFVILTTSLILFGSCKKDLKDVAPNVKECTISFSPEGGAFDDEIEVQLSANINDVKIYYTIGEDNPTENSSLLSGPIKISHSSVIKAIAVKDGQSSKVFSNEYNITPKINSDYFPYTVGSVWEYAVEQRSGTSGANSNITTEAGFMLMKVVDFDQTNFVASLQCTHTGMAKTALPAMFYLRKTVDGVDYSTDKLTWKTFLSTSMLRDNDSPFFVANSPGKPSSLLGSLQSAISVNSYSCTAGNFSTLQTKKEYMPSSNDNYMYTDDAYEHFSKEVGFVNSYYYSYDGSDYPAFVYKRTVSLSAYKIIAANGSEIKGGTLLSENPTPPEAPTELMCTWKSTNSIEIEWKDNSLNETGFVIEKRNVTDGEVTFTNLTSTNSDINTFIDNNVQSDKAYEYKVKSINSFGESDFTSAFFINKYGIPRAPSDLTVSYKSADVMEGLRWVTHYWVELKWKDNSIDEASFQISMKYGLNGEWSDLSFTTTANSTSANLTNGYYLKWTSGNYSFKIRAKSQYGDSEDSNWASTIIF